MPELPEVETIRRGLEPRICGLTIREVEWGDRKVFVSDPAEIADQLPGQKVQAISRRGKFLIFRLDRNFLLVHLGMTGQLTLRDPDREDPARFLRHPVTGLQRTRQHPPDRHTHFLAHLNDGRLLMYRDPRKFGRIRLLPVDDGLLDRLFARMGPEPLDSGFRLDDFLSALARRKRVRVKSLLLDQSFVAGVGNIYADEALFEAGIHPARRVASLRKKEKARLYETIPEVLRRGIQFGGTSLRDYIDSDGESGNNQDELNVYGRDGQPCRRCGTTVHKTVIAQRGTHFCPCCQMRRR